MCGIAIVPKKTLKEHLENQKVRGLDSLGLIDFQNKEVLISFKDNLAEYQEYIDSVMPATDELCFMHHRKASIGAITIDNSHPFIGKKFILAQNGTSKDFFAEYGAVYGKETDSETLLMHLENTCNTLEECIDVLDSIECPLGIIFVFQGDKTLIYADSCRGSYMQIADNIVEKDGKEEVESSNLISFTNLKEKSNLEYRNGFYMIIESATGKILEEWNYDDNYNSEVWNYATTHGIKSAKKTRATKKKGVGPTGSKPYNYNNQQSAIIVGPKKKQGKKKMKKSLKSIVNITTVMDSYTYKDLTDSDSIGIILDDYGVLTRLNDTAQELLAQSCFRFMSDEDNYKYVYGIANAEIFNYNLKTKDYIIIEPIFLLPPEYLVEINVVGSMYKFINLIRHVRYLTNLEVDQHIAYFEGLEYFGSKLREFRFTEEFNRVQNHPVTLETFLWLNYELEPTDQMEVFEVPDLGINISAQVTGFIKAAHVFGFSAEDLNIDKALYDNLTSRY